MLPDDVTATALVSLDDDVIATTPEISEGDIIQQLWDHQEQGEEEENDDEISIEEIFDPVVEKPSKSAKEVYNRYFWDSLFTCNFSTCNFSKGYLQTLKFLLIP